MIEQATSGGVQEQDKHRGEEQEAQANDAIDAAVVAP
jgi:hypothetical protein